MEQVKRRDGFPSYWESSGCIPWLRTDYSYSPATLFSIQDNSQIVIIKNPNKNIKKTKANINNALCSSPYIRGHCIVCRPQNYLFTWILNSIIFNIITFSGAAFANTRNTPACSAFEIHIFEPFMTKKSPFFSALVSIANASLPEATSDRQKLPTLRKKITHFKYFVLFKKYEKKFKFPLKVLNILLRVAGEREIQKSNQ